LTTRTGSSSLARPLWPKREWKIHTPRHIRPVNDRHANRAPSGVSLAATAIRVVVVIVTEATVAVAAATVVAVVVDMVAVVVAVDMVVVVTAVAVVAHPADPVIPIQRNTRLHLRAFR